MEKIVAWCADRLDEPSTWRGMVWVLSAFGVTIQPELWSQITAIGMAAAGIMGVVSKDPGK